MKLLSVKVLFPRTEKSTRYRYEKAILYHFNQSNDSKIYKRLGQTKILEKNSQNLHMGSGPSFMGGRT